MSDISQPLSAPLSKFDVSGKAAIITGASGTFGRGVALTLAAMRGRLCRASGSQDELDAVAAEVADLGGECVTTRRRPDSLDDAQATLDAAFEAFGRVDQLVIASGFTKAGFMEDQPLEEWEQVMDANLRGNWLMAKAMGSWWIENRVRGKMLMMSSVRSRHGNYAGYTGSCTSKGATDALTRVLAAEWAQLGITVNAIAPTVFRSKLTAWMWSDDAVGQATRKRSLARIPLGRPGEVEDLTGMALYLFSRASASASGRSGMSTAATRRAEL